MWASVVRAHEASEILMGRSIYIDLNKVLTKAKK